MRTDLLRGFADAARLSLGLALLAGCPGTLSDKEQFFVDGKFVWGDAASASSENDAAATPLDGGGDRIDIGVDSGGMSDPCGDVPVRVFAPSCGGSGCHGGLAPQNGLNLESPGVAQRVVGKTAMACPATLADPKNPDSSLLYTKVGQSPPCGAPMPLGRPSLSKFDIACIRAWIAAQ